MALTGDKDRARLTYRLTTLAPTPPPFPGVASVPVGPVAAKP